MEKRCPKCGSYWIGEFYELYRCRSCLNIWTLEEVTVKEPEPTVFERRGVPLAKALR